MRTTAAFLVLASIGLFFAGAFTLGLFSLVAGFFSDLIAETFER